MSLGWLQATDPGLLLNTIFFGPREHEEAAKKLVIAVYASARALESILKSQDIPKHLLWIMSFCSSLVPLCSLNANEEHYDPNQF